VVSSRRTVRVAIALAAGQAALCAVIGWVTFGPGLDGSVAGKPLDSVAGAPAVIPAPSVGVPPAPLPVPSSPKPAARTTSRTHERPAAEKPRTTRAAVAETRQSPAPAPAPTSTPSAAGTTSAALLPPSPPRQPDDMTGSASPDPTAAAAEVEVGVECDDEGAPAVTIDDHAVQCVRGDDGVLRWQLA
jgi:hypothetical protein